MPGNERQRKHPLGRGRAVGVRLPEAAEANLGARPADPDSTASNVCAALVADTSVTSDQMDRPGQVIETYGTEDTDPQRHPVLSAAANHGLMPAIRPLRTVRCSANKAQLTGLHP